MYQDGSGEDSESDFSSHDRESAEEYIRVE